MKLSIFESESGYTTTLRGMWPLVTACAVYAMLKLDFPADWIILRGPGYILAGCFFAWWLLNVYHIGASQAAERERLRSEAQPEAVNLRLHIELAKANTDQAEALRFLSKDALTLAEQLHAFPNVIISGGAGGYGGVGTYLELEGERIPGAFCAAWLTKYINTGKLPPIGEYSSKERNYVTAIITALKNRSAIIPAAGNVEARWTVQLPDEARWGILNDLGIPRAAQDYMEQTPQMEQQ